MDEKATARIKVIALVVVLITAYVIGYLVYKHTDAASQSKHWLSNFQSSIVSTFANVSEQLDDARNTSNGTWKQPQQPSNVETPIRLSSNEPRKVFLFAYMRGGSSIGGELFNQDPHATMWYEPNDAFFCSYYGLKHENLPQNDLYFKNMSRRQLDPDENKALTDYFSNMLTCHYQDLPPEAMGHYFLGESTAMDHFRACTRGRTVNINKCVAPISNFCSTRYVETARRNGCHIIIKHTREVLKTFAGTSQDFIVNQIQKVSNVSRDLAEKFRQHESCLQIMKQESQRCLPPTLEKCLSDQVRVLQVNRVKMEDLEPLIQRHPDVYVIYYIRDPRAILMSRIRHKNLLWKLGKTSLTEEIRVLCHRMNEDLRQRNILAAKYPRVSFLQIKYEDLAQRPESTADNIYTFLGKPTPEGWARFAKQTMHAKVNSGSGFGISVANATETAFRWKKTFPREQLKLAEKLCRDFLLGAGYELTMKDNTSRDQKTDPERS